MVPPEGQEPDHGLGVGFFIRNLLSSRERARHPQSLTESERVVIGRATAPILHDLEASGAIVPEILYHTSGNYSRDGRDGVTTDIARDGGHDGNVWIPTEECSSAEQVWWAAEELQEWEIHELWEAGRPATWPECPQHPGTHPLEPGTDDMDTAVWRCPSTQQAICAIGALGSDD